MGVDLKTILMVFVINASIVLSFPSMSDDSWYEVNPAYPHLITSQSSIAYDQDRGELIMWGGHPTHGGYPQLEEVFVFNIEQGQWRVDRPIGDSPPNICVTNDAVFDEARGVYMVMLKSESGSHNWHRTMKFKSEIKVYDLDEKKWYWMQPYPGILDTYSGIANPKAAAYDSHNQVMLFFPKESGTGTWIYDLYTNYWEQIASWSAGPNNRYVPAITYDRREKKFVLYGGTGEAYDTWLFDLASKTWTERPTNTHPPCVTSQGTNVGACDGSVYGPTGTYDTVNEINLFFINRWYEDRIEPWSYDIPGNTWTQMASSPFALGSRGGDTLATFMHDKNAVVVYDLNRRGYQNEAGGNCDSQCDEHADKRHLFYYRYASANPPGPRPPEELMINMNPDSVILDWDDVSNVVGYRVFRGSGTNGKSWEVSYSDGSGLISVTTWTDNDVNPGNIYYYYVVSEDTSGEISLESTMARTQALPPWEAVVSVLSDNSVEIEWTPNNHNNIASGIKGYNVYRADVTPEVYALGIAAENPEDEPVYSRKTIKKVVSIGSWSKLNSEIIAGNNYVDNVDLAADSSEYGRPVYAYMIRSVDELDMESGNSPYWLTIPQAVPHLNWRESWNATNGVIDLEWHPSEEKNILGYRVWYLSAHGGENTELTTVPIPGTKYRHVIDGDEASNFDIGYFVTATDALGQDGIPSAKATVNRNSKQTWEGFGYLDDYHVLSGTIDSDCGPADANYDNSIDATEIFAYVSGWKSGYVMMSNLMTGISEWKNGC